MTSTIRDGFTDSTARDYWYYVDASAVMSRGAYSLIDEIVKSHDTERFYLVTVEPDPRSYYLHHFGWSPICEMSPNDSEEKYVRVLFEEPGMSPADAVGYKADIFAIIPDSDDCLSPVESKLGGSMK